MSYAKILITLMYAIKHYQIIGIKNKKGDYSQFLNNNLP